MSIRNKWAAYAQGRPDVTVELFSHTGYDHRYSPR